MITYISCRVSGSHFRCYLPLLTMSLLLSVINFVSMAYCRERSNHKFESVMDERNVYMNTLTSSRAGPSHELKVVPSQVTKLELSGKESTSNLKRPKTDSSSASHAATTRVAEDKTLLSQHSTVAVTLPVKPSPPAETNEYNFQQYFEDAPQCNEKLSVDQIDFTFVSQTSMERLWIMEYICASWDHDISLAVHIEPQSNDTAESIREDLVDYHNCSTERLTVRTVGGYSKKDYPVNLLRNTALMAVKTSHVILMDIDFWIPRNLYTELQRHTKELSEDHKLALVIPAFELKSQCSGDSECEEENMAVMPETKTHLRDLWMNQKKASIFKDFYPPGHGSTRYDDWKEQADDVLLPIECIKSDLYEPYMAFRFCHDLPPFQEAFYGYGYNKYAWMKQTRRSGYHYKQIGGSYALHYPHEKSDAREKFNDLIKNEVKGGNRTTTSLYYEKLDRTFEAFLDWLNQTVADETVVALCEK